MQLNTFSKDHSLLRLTGVKTLFVMKWVAILIFASAMQVSAKGYAQKISLKQDNATLEEVLNAIHQQTGYLFLYDTRALKGLKGIDVNVKDATLQETLDQCVAKYSLGYLLEDKTILIFPQKATRKFLKPSREVEGTVTDNNGTALSGVTVRIKNSNIGTITDQNGHFSIEVGDGNTVLQYSYLGFQTREVRVGNQSEIKITLQPSTSSLDQLVVIGYGARREKDITGAISSMGSKDIEKSTALSPELAMQGQMAGVSVVSGGGNPIARPIIRIRGVNTFNNADPLYVIDGVPVVAGGTSASSTSAAAVNIFSLVNPNDIASISVLKDASAAAIYGVRAANGVILITTKKGKKGKATINFSASMGIQNIPKTFNMLNTQQYVTLYQEAYANNPTVDANTGQPVPIGKSTFGPAYDPSSAEYLGNGPTYDWQKAVLNKNAPVNKYIVSVSGASDHTDYYFSAGYDYIEGGLQGDKAERYTIATNVTSRINKVIETGINLHLMNENPTTNSLGHLGNAASTPPWQPVYDPDGPDGFAPVAKATFKPNPNYDPSKLSPGAPYVFDQGPTILWGPQSRSNPLGMQAFQLTTSNNQLLIGSAYIQVEPLTGLKIKGTVSGNLYHTKSKTWNGYKGWVFSQSPKNPYGSQNGNAAGSLNIIQTQTNNLIKGVNVDYSHIFGKHFIDIMLDASHQYYTYHIMQANTSQVNYDDPDLRNFLAVKPYAAGAYFPTKPYALIGYLGRVSYRYNDKFLVDITLRRDGSSRFAKGHQWGTFPSFSAAWRITQESFMKGVQWLNDLKIRGGYGALGNEQTTAGFAYLSTAKLSPHYALGSGNGDGFGIMQMGAYLPTFPNASLSWEKVYTSDIGFDAVMFNNSLSLTADYYYKKTKGIIQSIKLPGNAGIETPTDENVADVLNSGIEFQAGYNQQFGKLGVSLSANFTTVHNEVLSLYQHVPDRASGLEEGYPIGFIYGYKTGGIFQDQKQVDDWKTKYRDAVGANDPRPGDMYFLDLYGDPAPGQTTKNMQKDGVINNNDQTYLGSTIPKFYYGFNIGLNFHNADFSTSFQGVGGIKKYSTDGGGEAMSSNGINQWISVLDRWTPQHHSATIPRAVFNDPNVNARKSDRFVESAAYLRLQNIQLGYTFPASLLQRSGFIRSIRVYVSGINLFTLTKWTGPDPENNLYPSTRQFIGGINASF